MELILSCGYVLAAFASAAAAIKTGDYRLLLGIPIAFSALFTVTFAPVARTILETASKDTAIFRPIRAIAWVLVRFAWMMVLIWSLAFAALLFSDHFVGAWLVGTYIVASNTIRWYRAAYLPPIPSGAPLGKVVPGETAAALDGMWHRHGLRPRKEEYSLAQARALLMLMIAFAHQLYQAFVEPNGWSNPLIYLMLAIVIFCAILVVAIGAARAPNRQIMFRLCVFALALPWFLGILYVIDGLFQLAAIPYGIYIFRDSIGKMVGRWDFWSALFTGLVTGIFWTAVGNSLRKSTNALARAGVQAAK